MEADPPAAPAPASTYDAVSRGAWRLLAGAVLVQCGISIVDQGLPTLIGFMKADAGVSAAVASLFVSAFVLGRCVASYGAGIAADRFGERRVLLAGCTLMGAIIAAAAAAPLPALLVALVAAGMASAVATPAGGRLVLVAFPRNRQGFALGVRQTGVPIGGLVAAAVLPWIAHVASWRWAVAAAGCIAVASVLPLLASPTESGPPPPRTSRRDFKPGRNRDIRLLTIWASLFVSSQYAVLAFLALDLHQRMGFGLAAASIFVAVAQGAGIVGRISWGLLSDHLLSRGRKPLLLALTAVGVAGTAGLLALPSSSPVLVVGVAAAVAGLGVIGFQGLFIVMLADTVDAARVGAATGWSVAFVQTTIVVASPLYGLVADWSGSYRTIWAVLTLVLACAFVPAALVRNR
jgi:MFS family permease